MGGVLRRLSLLFWVQAACMNGALSSGARSGFLRFSITAIPQSFESLDAAGYCLGVVSMDMQDSLQLANGSHWVP